MNNPSPRSSYGNGRLIGGHTPDYLVGRILTLVEALGLKDNQEKSAKDLFRSEIYQALEDNNSNIWISENLNNSIREILEEIRNKAEVLDPMQYSFKITYEVKR